MKIYTITLKKNNYSVPCDHLGNVRSVATKDLETNVVEEVQQTHYYPFGGIIADISWGRDVQKRLFNGKELDASNTLYWYDYGASARDVGNIAAGYIAASNGISWIATRMAFDLYQSITDRRWSPEGFSSQNAQLLGWKWGFLSNYPIRQIGNLLSSVIHIPHDVYKFFKK